jgi:hypothetical protein
LELEKQQQNMFDPKHDYEHLIPIKVEKPPSPVSAEVHYLLNDSHRLTYILENIKSSRRSQAENRNRAKGMVN